MCKDYSQTTDDLSEDHVKLLKHLVNHINILTLIGVK